jgi:hypothetical protein
LNFFTLYESKIELHWHNKPWQTVQPKTNGKLIRRLCNLAVGKRKVRDVKVMRKLEALELPQTKQIWHLDV